MGAQYCISSGGTITDGSGRGCILTPPTTQFQCDTGATPDSGFSVSSNGQLQHNGDDTFYACPADENEYNVYTQKVEGQDKCTKITLSTGGECQENGGGYGGESSAPAETTTYACNPAHSYPNGASCVSTGGSLTLVTPPSEAPAPGTSKSKGGYGGDKGSTPAVTTTAYETQTKSYEQPAKSTESEEYGDKTTKSYEQPAKSAESMDYG